jgi:hypothetical protein
LGYKGNFEVLSFKVDDDNYRTYVGEQEIEIEVPDDYDPRGQQIVWKSKNKRSWLSIKRL